MIYLMFLSALSLSASAAYYSIAGLVAIFASAKIPIVIMGSSLEFAKLVIASWTYRNWKQIPVLMRTYFVITLVILMGLTSMGIFGYLAESHLSHATPAGDVAAQISLIDEKLKTEKETINEARITISQLNSQVDQTIARTSNDTTDRGIGRSVSIRKSQATERKELFKTIETSQAEISKLNQEKAPLASQLRRVEAEVGPIKYIAALIYDDVDNDILEKSVRIVILLIVSVFDPLAVLMLIAANWSLKNSRNITSSQEFFDRGKELSQSIDSNDGKIETANTHAYLENPWKWTQSNAEDSMLGLVPKVKSTPKEKSKPAANSIIKSFFQDTSKPKSIEQEIDQLQSSIDDTPKSIEYDSVGRRITP